MSSPRRITGIDRDDLSAINTKKDTPDHPDETHDLFTIIRPFTTSFQFFIPNDLSPPSLIKHSFLLAQSLSYGYGSRFFDILFCKLQYITAYISIFVLEDPQQIVLFSLSLSSGACLQSYGCDRLSLCVVSSSHGFPPFLDWLFESEISD